MLQSIHSGLSLEQCLEAYTKEETLEEEDSWYCSNCQAHRRGVMKIDLWKMPDVLVSSTVGEHRETCMNPAHRFLVSRYLGSLQVLK